MSWLVSTSLNPFLCVFTGRTRSNSEEWTSGICSVLSGCPPAANRWYQTPGFCTGSQRNQAGATSSTDPCKEILCVQVFLTTSIFSHCSFYSVWLVITCITSGRLRQLLCCVWLILFELCSDFTYFITHIPVMKLEKRETGLVLYLSKVDSLMHH